MNLRDLAFHGLAIKRNATAGAIAELMDLPEPTVAALLAQATVTGRVAEVKGGYVLAPLTRVALEARYGASFAVFREDPAFLAAYQRFETINVSLKQVITDWQTSHVQGERVPNDHNDPAYDEKVIDRLAEVHDRVAPVLDKLATKLPRLAVYMHKLASAIERAEGGELDWVSDVRRDSYHTVWFELHEDLLRIMGTARAE